MRMLKDLPRRVLLQPLGVDGGVADMNWLNLKEWGKLHGLSSCTVKRYIQRGLIPEGQYIHAGRTYRIKPDAVVVNLQPKIKVTECKDFDKELEAI